MQEWLNTWMNPPQSVAQARIYFSTFENTMYSTTQSPISNQTLWELLPIFLECSTSLNTEIIYVSKPCWHLEQRATSSILWVLLLHQPIHVNMRLHKSLPTFYALRSGWWNKLNNERWNCVNIYLLKFFLGEKTDFFLLEKL